MQAARTGTGLGGTKDDDVVDAQLVRNLGQRSARDKRHLQACELALVKLRIGLKQGACDHGAQNGIAQKLKALIAGRNRLALDCRGMRERRAQQHLIIELMAQDFLGTRKSFRQSQDLGLPGVFDRVDGVGDRVEREQGLVIDLEVELVLDGRNQLQTLERIGIEVVKSGLIANFGNIDAQNVSSDLGDLVEDFGAVHSASSHSA